MKFTVLVVMTVLILCVQITISKSNSDKQEPKKNSEIQQELSELLATGQELQEEKYKKLYGAGDYIKRGLYQLIKYGSILAVTSSTIMVVLHYVKKFFGGDNSIADMDAHMSKLKPSRKDKLKWSQTDAPIQNEWIKIVIDNWHILLLVFVLTNVMLVVFINKHKESQSGDQPIPNEAPTQQQPILEEIAIEQNDLPLNKMKRKKRKRKKKKKKKRRAKGTKKKKDKKNAETKSKR